MAGTLGPMRIHSCARRGDLTGVRGELDAGVPVDVRDPDTDLTPLAEAVTSPLGTREVVQLLLERGADPNAACGGQKPTPVLLHAVRCWDVDVIEALLEGGADITIRSASGYDALTSCMYGPGARHDPRLLATVELLLRRGAPLGGTSKHGEAALTVASRVGRFEVVGRLLEAGEESGPLRWSLLHRAVALGSASEVERVIIEKPDLEARDCWDRTPWLLSMVVGDLAKVRALAAAGADRAARGRGGRAGLLFAVEAGRLEVVEWLLTEGANPDEADDVGQTGLMVAASEGDAEIVRRFIAGGADVHRTNRYRQSAMSLAASEEVMRALEKAGADPGDLSERLRRQLVRFEPRRLDELCTRADFERERVRRFGTSNPERMDLPFWRAMVSARAGAWSARRAFARGEEARDAVWCYERYGQSITELPDGRIVEVGGEHEDFYDPDFCIYNDVVVHDGLGGFTIYGYPKEVFPPTDFHTATLVGAWIYLVGSLGYRGERDHGRAQVFRLSVDDFRVERVETRGDDPGWISKHRAQLHAPASIHVSAGKVDTGQAYTDNGQEFVLDLGTHTWRRLAHHPVPRTNGR